MLLVHAEAYQARVATERVSLVADWCVVHTKSRQEKALVEDLQTLGIEHYLPVVKTARYYGKRKLIRGLPLFPGYVFMRGGKAELIAADRTRRVVRFLQAPDPTKLGQDLASIRIAIENSGELVPTPLLKDGVPVEITSGPFRGVIGVVASMANARRVVLNVDLIGRAAALEIERELLRPL